MRSMVALGQSRIRAHPRNPWLFPYLWSDYFKAIFILVEENMPGPFEGKNFASTLILRLAYSDL